MSTDPQYLAFAESGESDWAKAAQWLEGAVVHEPGDPDAEPIRTPEEWDADGWDSERQPPKTLSESDTALVGRVADLDAPDERGLSYATARMTAGQRGEA